MSETICDDETIWGRLKHFFCCEGQQSEQTQLEDYDELEYDEVLD